MTCKCGSNRIIEVYAHSRDCNNFIYGQYDKSGYVPYGLGVGGGDSVEFDFCAECGQIQEFKPLTDAKILESFGFDEEAPDSYGVQTEAQWKRENGITD